MVQANVDSIPTGLGFPNGLNRRVIEVITFYGGEIALFARQFRRWNLRSHRGGSVSEQRFGSF